MGTKTKKKVKPGKGTDEKAEVGGMKMKGAALYDYLLNEVGGHDAAVKGFAKKRFNNLSKKMTLREALDVAESEGWGEILGAMTLGDLRGPKAPSRPRVASGKKNGATAKDVQAKVQKVLSEYKGPVAARVVADELEVDVRVVARALSALVKAGTAKRSGSKRNSQYSSVA